MKEKDFIPVFMAAYKTRFPDTWCYKIADSRYTGNKPFDVFGFTRYSDGSVRPLAFEFKLHKSLGVWSLSKVTDYQLTSLQEAASFGADARIILGVRVLLSLEEQAKYAAKTRRLAMDFCWTPAAFLELKAKGPTLNIRNLLKEGYGRRE